MTPSSLETLLYLLPALLAGYGAGRLVARHGPGPNGNAAVGLFGAVFCAGIHQQFDLFPYLILASFFAAYLGGVIDLARLLAARPALPRMALPVPGHRPAWRPVRAPLPAARALRLKRAPQTPLLKV